jgi:hypothetical protein
MNLLSSRKLAGAVVLSAMVLAGQAAENAPVFQEDFTQVAPGKPATNFMVVDGLFEVKAAGAEKYLELPGAPLENFGVLFGPQASSNLCVTARIHAASTGRRHPMFAVGLNGIGGLKLWVAPGREQLELHQGDKLLAAAPLSWKSGTWAHLKLQLRRAAAGGYVAEGKSWTAGEAEPVAWALSAALKEPPPPGRASVWGAPFSGRPIRFDDLAIWRVPEA